MWPFEKTPSAKATEEQNQLLREQNSLLRELLAAGGHPAATPRTPTSRPTGRPRTDQDVLRVTRADRLQMQRQAQAQTQAPWRGPASNPAASPDGRTRPAGDGLPDTNPAPPPAPPPTAGN